MSNSPTLSMAATMQGVILGTAAYMSAERTSGDRHADQYRADLVRGVAAPRAGGFALTVTSVTTHRVAVAILIDEAA